jgi:hypothetical protein
MLRKKLIDSVIGITGIIGLSGLSFQHNKMTELGNLSATRQEKEGKIQLPIAEAGGLGVFKKCSRETPAGAFKIKRSRMACTSRPRSGEYG